MSAPQPPVPEGWRPFGDSAARYGVDLEFSNESDDEGFPLWEREKVES